MNSVYNDVSSIDEHANHTPSGEGETHDVSATRTKVAGRIVTGWFKLQAGCGLVAVLSAGCRARTASQGKLNRPTLDRMLVAQCLRPAPAHLGAFLIRNVRVFRLGLPVQPPTAFGLAGFGPGA